MSWSQHEKPRGPALPAVSSHATTKFAIGEKTQQLREDGSALVHTLLSVVPDLTVLRLAGFQIAATKTLTQLSAVMGLARRDVIISRTVVILGIQEIGKTTDAERFCRDALALHARLFRLWHRFRDGPGVRYGPLTREQLIAKSIPLEKKFFALADRYIDSGDKDVANLALALLQHFERFFAFLRHDGVEPTNNVAERALRCAVQWRKISFWKAAALRVKSRLPACFP